MEKLFTNNFGDLVEAQRASFYRFLAYGIAEEFSAFPNPFLAKIRTSEKKRFPCFVYLYPNEIKLKGPNFTIENCLKQDLSYSIQIYIPAEYSYPVEQKTDFSFSSSKQVTKITPSKKLQITQDIFFGEIPLMTEEGTFIISGCERVIISQIIRSPGIYFRKEFNNTRKAICTATVISNKGLWTKFFLDQNDEKKKKDTEKIGKSSFERIYIKFTDYKTKVSSVMKEENFQNDEEDSQIDNFDEEDFKEDESKLSIYELIRYFGITFEEILDTLKYPLHLKNHQYITKKRNELEIPLLIRKLFFNQRSGCFSIGEIGRYKINKKLGLNLPKNVTNLTGLDFIRIIDGLIELKYYDGISDDIDNIKNKQIRCIGDLLQNQIRIGLFRLQKNLMYDSPIQSPQKLTFDLDSDSESEDYILDPRPLTSSIKEFFKTSQLSQYMDQVNPLAEITHKRRISVFGPNGLKRDHISTVIRDIHPSQYGRLCPIETPEGQNAGLISSLAMFGRISSLGSIETPYFFLKEKKIFSTKKIFYFNPEQESQTKVTFCDIKINKKNEILDSYISIKENYLFSIQNSKNVNFITTSPLQIVSLATALIPFLEHDDANRALMGSNMQRQAVPLLYTQKPIVGTGLEAIAILDSEMVIKSYSEGWVDFCSSNLIRIKDLKNQTINYSLKKNWRSNQETCINQKPIVWNGEKIFSGQIIADGPGTQDGELSLGHNLTIAYIPWEGYNYEDAIVINEKLIIKDCLTSVHIEEHETHLTYCVNGSEKLTNNLPHLTKYIRRHLTSSGIVKVGSYVKEHEILVGKLTPCEEDSSPQAKLFRALYGQPKKNYKDTSLRVEHGMEGRVIDVRIISTTSLNKSEPSLSTASEIIRIYIAQIRKIQVGDKLAGRHGNKGIISRILNQQDMPYLPDGTPVDILFNPLGVPSRMNVGQVFECLLGFAGEKLGKRFKVTPFDEIYGNEASRVLINQKLKEASKKDSLSWIFQSAYPGKVFLRDGRTGEYFDNAILVGKSYILKLIHLVEDKIHARATGPYSMITEQPLAGKSQKGGQRFGEMEVWALEAYGCSNTLQELLTIKSDDIDGRNDMYESILSRKQLEKPNPSIPEAFLALIRELNALGLDFSLRKIEGGFNSLTKFIDIEKKIFEELETRLKLRTLLSQKKVEQFSKSSMIKKSEKNFYEKIKEKKKILEKYQKEKNNSF
jgi:DNA-directed RNA polymerase subunit beta